MNGLDQGSVSSLILRLILSEKTALVSGFGLELSQPPPRMDTSQVNILSVYYELILTLVSCAKVYSTRYSSKIRHCFSWFKSDSPRPPQV